MSDKYISLYRKYRPTTFEELVEQKHIVNTLQNQVKTNKIAHAYLFTGSRGTGKTTCAKIFAKAVNCLAPKNGSPCGECEVCKKLSKANMDVIEIDAASNNSVEDIRDMRENINFTPVDARYKVYIIDEVHMLSPSAFNALLKSIEEPPEHIIFILATTEVHKIPATILSRVVRLDFKLVSFEGLKQHLSFVLNKEEITAEDSAIAEMAYLANGSVRDMLSIAECVVGYAGKKITYNDVLTCMGTSANETLNKLAMQILSKDVGGFFEEVNSLYECGKNFALLSKELVLYFRNILVCKTCKDAKSIINLPIQDFEKVDELAKKFSQDDIFSAMSEFISAESEFRYASNAKMLFESIGILCMSSEDVKKNEVVEENNASQQKEMSAKEIWGQIMSLAYEKEYFALHAMCGDFTNLVLKDNNLIASTYKNGVAESYKKFKYDKIMQELVKELNFNVQVEINQLVKKKTELEIKQEKLIKIFDNKIKFED